MSDPRLVNLFLQYPSGSKRWHTPKPVRAAVDDASGGIPFWKRELRLRRRPPFEAVLDTDAQPIIEPVIASELVTAVSAPEEHVPVIEPVKVASNVLAAEEWAEPETAPAQPDADAPTETLPALPVAERPSTDAEPEPAAEPEPVAEPEPAAEPEPVAEAEREPGAEETAPEVTAPSHERRASKRRGSLRHAESQTNEVDEPAPATRNERAARRSRGVKQIVGLRIGSSQLAAACVANNGSPELVQIAREPLPPGVVVGGELRDPDALAAALDAFFKKHKLPRKGVRLGIASNRVGVRSVDITGIEDPAQLTNAVRFRAQDALPIPLNEAALDYHVLEESVNEDGVKTHHILLVVAYRDLVDRYAAACRKAGIKLIGVDLEAFALLRALSAPRASDAPAAGALVAVAVGNDSSILAVSDGRVCEFTRLLDWGGSNLDIAIAKTLDITAAEAEPIKRRLAVNAPEDVLEGISAAQAKKLRAAILDEMHSFGRELVSSLAFYQNQPGSLEIGEIVLTGGGSNFTGLAAQLQKLSGVKVSVGDPFGRVKVGKRVEQPESIGSLAVAIGLGIED